jgi:DMSO reductase anchor subunit
VSAQPELGATRVAGRPGRRGGGREDESPSPYGRPVIKEPVWTWEIPVYFYAGGLAGASAGIGRLAEARGNDLLARRASALALAGAVASPALLISDLGRPERFLHMLRLFKITSPMSVGSWILSAFGAAAGTGWLDHVAGGRVPAGRPARTAAALLGLPLAFYTAALLANTSVPVWHESRKLLPFVFVSGAAASAGGALAALTPVADAAPARRLAVAGAIAEIATKVAMEKGLGELSDAYETRLGHRLGILGKGAVAAGGAVIAVAGRRSRRAAVAGGVLVNVGAAVARWSVFAAGFQSAADPRHTVDPQRRRIDSGATPGASTRTAPAPAADGRGTPGRSEAVEEGRPASEAESG